MGLTIHYTIKSNIRTRRDEVEENSDLRVRDLVVQMHNKALEMLAQGIFKEVSEIRYITEEDLLDKGEEWRWALTQAEYGLKHRFNLGKGIYGKTFYEDHYLRVKPEKGWIFRIWPAQGCEECNIGLLKYPQEIEVDNPKPVHRRTQFDRETLSIPTHLRKWQWSSFCKTQYSSNYGVMNFVKCHVGICEYFDFIKELPGISITVDDEGDYWDKRNIEELIKEIGEWNVMIASLFKTLQSTQGFDDISAPILEHPDFEQLEETGINALKLTDIVQIEASQRSSLFLSEVKTINDVIMWGRMFLSDLETSTDENALAVLKTWEETVENRYIEEIDPEKIMTVITDYQNSIKGKQ